MKYCLLLLLITSQAIANETRIEFKKFFGENEVTVTENNDHVKLLINGSKSDVIYKNKPIPTDIIGSPSPPLKIKLNIKNIEKILVLRKPEHYDKDKYDIISEGYDYSVNCHQPVKIASFILNPEKKISSIVFRMNLPCNGINHLTLWAKTKNGIYYSSTLTFILSLAHYP